MSDLKREDAVALAYDTLDEIADQVLDGRANNNRVERALSVVTFMFGLIDRLPGPQPQPTRPAEFVH